MDKQLVEAPTPVKTPGEQADAAAFRRKTKRQNVRDPPRGLKNLVAHTSSSAEGFQAGPASDLFVLAGAQQHLNAAIGQERMHYLCRSDNLSRCRHQERRLRGLLLRRADQGHVLGLCLPERSQGVLTLMKGQVCSVPACASPLQVHGNAWAASTHNLVSVSDRCWLYWRPMDGGFIYAWESRVQWSSFGLIL